MTISFHNYFTYLMNKERISIEPNEIILELETVA